MAVSFLDKDFHQLESSGAGKKFNKFVKPRGSRGVCESGKRKLTLDRSDSPGAKLRRLAK